MCPSAWGPVLEISYFCFCHLGWPWEWKSPASNNRDWNWPAPVLWIPWPQSGLLPGAAPSQWPITAGILRRYIPTKKTKLANPFKLVLLPCRKVMRAQRPTSTWWLSVGARVLPWHLMEQFSPAGEVQMAAQKTEDLIVLLSSKDIWVFSQGECRCKVQGPDEGHLESQNVGWGHLGGNLWGCLFWSKPWIPSACRGGPNCLSRS